MKTIIKRIGLLPMVGILAGCSSFKATILPQQNNTYSSIATASSYKEALDNATGKAGQTCDDLKRKLVVLDRSEEFKPAEESTAVRVTNTLSRTVLKLTPFGMFSGGSDNAEDHKVSVLFRCE